MRSLFRPSAPPPPSLYTSPPPSPSPSSPYLDITRDGFSPHSVPVAQNVFDLATICFICGLILLSLLAFSSILLLRLRSRRLHHLQNFTSLWTARLLLVFFACFWSFNEVLRLPYVRQKYLHPVFPSITLKQQTDICKLHVVLSFGLLEPGFLITLLFLVNVSIKKRNLCHDWAPLSVLILCLPILLLQIFFVYFTPMETQLPGFVHGSSVLAIDFLGNTTVLCTYPFFSCLIFGGFTVAYAMAFLVSCWRVMAFVINKGIRLRINVLATTVMLVLPVQILGLSLTWLWLPEDMSYEWVVLVMVLCVAICMAVGEIILVIKPIMDALNAGADRDSWTPLSRAMSREDEGELKGKESSRSSTEHPN